MKLRDKELMINYICKLYKPIDKELEDILKFIFDGNRVRLNHEVGRQMMRELKPYKVDPDRLGTKNPFGEEDEEADAQEYSTDERIKIFEEKAPQKCKPKFFI